MEQAAVLKAHTLGKEMEDISYSYRDIRNLIEFQPKTGRWIPCSERLPEDNQNVIACFAHGTVTEMCFYGKKFHGIYDYDEKVIVAWQPLPEAYKG